jgi:hypothetical protein
MPVPETGKGRATASGRSRSGGDCTLSPSLVPPLFSREENEWWWCLRREDGTCSPPNPPGSRRYLEAAVHLVAAPAASLARWAALPTFATGNPAPYKCSFSLSPVRGGCDPDCVARRRGRRPLLASDGQERVRKPEE